MDSGTEQSLEGHTGSIYCLAQGGVYLFSGGDDKGVKTWQYANERFEALTELQGHQQPVQSMLTINADPTRSLFSADRGGTVAKWCLDSGALQATMATNHTSHLMALWNQDTFLFSAALDGHVKVWDTEGNQVFDQVRDQLVICTRARTRARMAHESARAGMHVGVDVQRAAHRSAQVVTNQNNQPSGVTAIMVVPEGDSSVLITACDDKALKLWMMPTFDKRGILASRVGHSDVVRCLAKGPGNSFFSGSMDNSIMVWEFMSG
jgi:WD40 repeat protein